MRIFKINEHIEVVCDWVKTRMAFKHVATLFIDGIEHESTKICYQNRTWESYEYQSVLQKIIRETTALTPEQKEQALAFANKDNTDWSSFKMISGIAKLGELLTTNQKDSNDWKTRMLKAGLESYGLEMPDDWDALDEPTKEQRLNAVIQMVQTAGDTQ